MHRKICQVKSDIIIILQLHTKKANESMQGLSNGHVNLYHVNVNLQLSLTLLCMLTGLTSISPPTTRSVISSMTWKSLLGFKRAKLNHAWFQSNSQHNYLLDLQEEQAYHLINCPALVNSAVHFSSNRMMICPGWFLWEWPELHINWSDGHFPHCHQTLLSILAWMILLWKSHKSIWKTALTVTISLEQW